MAVRDVGQLLPERPDHEASRHSLTAEGFGLGRQVERYC